MVNDPGMIPSHGRKRSASPSLRSRSSDGDTSSKKLKTNKRARSASPSVRHRSPTKKAKKKKTAHSSGDTASSPIPSLDSTTETKDQLAHRTVNHRRTRRASSSLPHRPPIDSDRLAKKSKMTHSSGDTIPVLPGEDGDEGGKSRHDNDNDHYPVPSLPRPNDSPRTDKDQQAHKGIILPAAEKPKKRKHELIVNLPYRPKPPTLEEPATKRVKRPQTTTRSVFPKPKNVWKSVSVGWNFGGPPSSR